MADARTFEQLRNIALFADALPVAIWVGRVPSGECVYVNRQFEKILGITPPEDASRGNYVGPYGVHLPTGEPYPEDRMPYERVLQARAPVVIEDLVIHRHDGTLTWLRVFASPLFDEQGEIAYVVEAFTDRTREVEGEEARRASERQVQVAQRLDAIGQLAAGVAHDFNNLLAVVKLVAAQLRQNEVDAQRLALISHLDEVADSAESLTRALLGTGRRRKSTSVPLDLGEVAARTVELGRRTLPRRFTVALDVPPEPAVIEGDAPQIEQVIMNLLVNARDATPGEGRITVRAATHELQEGAHPVLPGGRYVALEVADTGAGIDPSLRDRIFEPYVTSKVAGPLKGTGLGLATVFGVARAHGGHAEIAATGPQGTTMRVLFPASSKSLEAAAPAARRREAIPGSGAVLVVDDEALVRDTVAVVLRRLGYQVETAVDGAQAISGLATAPGSVDVVLLDLSMPGLSGRETFRALRERSPTLPVVLMSGAADEHEVQALLKEGVRAFLKKPFDDAGLSVAIAEARR